MTLEHHLHTPHRHRDPRSEVLTILEVAGILGISKAATYNLIASDKTFKTFKVGGLRRMRRQALEDWIAAQEAKA